MSQILMPHIFCGREICMNARQDIWWNRWDLLHVVRIRVGFRNKEGEPYNITKWFEVYRLNSDKTEWQRVESLGDQTLFIGYNHYISVSAGTHNYLMCKENAIY
ncbi:hypothetical protein QJS10_CPA06g00371 [Acorus calamus]|uniref:KIB1-4 beta-propeller domain-containing protein n=1 Tax=Acorus calamus TaxID=4465 RepID=A0AAV9EJQ4_ACOCL|nr:hypothetical protein QJS10_CPA06g00371 [Acorus calamus]